MKKEISKLSFRQLNLFCGLTGLNHKTINRYINGKPNHPSTVKAIEQGWKEFKEQVKGLK